ncbi:hypothetical protein ON058_00020 [Demequina sp. B12]|uniref:hypothetical protein n=1 Tax=Demequina sp. B12 TaxID=2992757 RepID=UPI00237B8B6B|nr:hypothetical protein [Demequina sp. B12]MDE0571800.1 hypothetical protein [Demequina sp. B12]
MTTGDSTESAENAQWSKAEGAPHLVEAVTEDMEKRLKYLKALPAENYRSNDSSDRKYVEEALRQVAHLIHDAEWLRRVLIDEVNGRNLIPQRTTAELAGVSFTTVQRWKKEPLQAFANDFGPDVPQVGP